MPNNGNNIPGWGKKKQQTTTPNVVKTNTSYNGDFVNVDLNKDYQSEINKAAQNKDYASASRLEAERNAKINYLNSQGSGTTYTPTYDYVKDYGYGNNQGGTVYTSNATWNDLNKGGTYQINGTTYHHDGAGTFKQLTGVGQNGANWSLVGNDINPTTGEFVYNNVNDAKNEYVRQMVMSGVAPAGATYDDLAKQGRVDDGYLNALASGNTNEYNQRVIAAAEAFNKQKQQQQSVGTNVKNDTTSLEEQARELAKEGITMTDLTGDGSFEDNSKWLQYISGVRGHAYRY